MTCWCGCLSRHGCNRATIAADRAGLCGGAAARAVRPVHDQAAVPNLAGEADLAWANGTLAAKSNVGQLAGPAVGGVLYAAVGAGPAFAANAVSFAISATLIAAVRGQFRGQHPAASDSGAPSSSIWAGARFLWHNTTLVALTVVGAVTFMATEIVAVADLPLIHDFGVGGVGYGIMNVAWGAGGLVSAVIAARVVTKDSETMAAVAGVLVFGIFVAAVGVAPWFALIPVFSLLLPAVTPSPLSASMALTSAPRRMRSAGACSLPWVLSLPSPARSALDSLDSWSRRQAGAWSTSAVGSLTWPARQCWP